MKFKLLIISCFLLLLNSCFLPGFNSGHRPPDYKAAFDKKSYDAGGQAFVIIGAKNDLSIPEMENKGGFYAQFKMIKTGTGRSYSVNYSYDSGGDIYANSAGGMDYVIIVSTGQFELTGYQLTASYYDGDGTYYRKLDMSDDYNFTFEVHPGDVLYLGTIVTIVKPVVSGTSYKYKTTIEDYSAYSADTFAALSELTGKQVQVKLMNFVDNDKGVSPVKYIKKDYVPDYTNTYYYDNTYDYGYDYNYNYNNYNNYNYDNDRNYRNQNAGNDAVIIKRK